MVLRKKYPCKYAGKKVIMLLFPDATPGTEAKAEGPRRRIIKKFHSKSLFCGTTK
jgi:hypothetical protein